MTSMGMTSAWNWRIQKLHRRAMKAKVVCGNRHNRPFPLAVWDIDWMSKGKLENIAVQQWRLVCHACAVRATQRHGIEGGPKK